MSSDIEERHNVAAKHPDVVRRLLELAEKCREDLRDLQSNRKGSGIREPGRVAQWDRPAHRPRRPAVRSIQYDEWIVDPDDAGRWPDATG